MNEQKARNLLVALSLTYKGDWDKIMLAIKNRERPTIDPDEAVLAVHTKFTTIFDNDYPEGLRNAYKPPFVLFYYGNLTLAKEMSRCVSYVGSRDASEYGIKMAHTLCSGLAEQGFTIVSGLALGIDRAAGDAALPYGRSIAVLGNGPDYFYPEENRDLQEELKTKGLVISEYPNDTPPVPKMFPLRNRIVAGLSKALIVGEAHPHSGTLITVAQALNMGRDVLAVPFHADEESFCNTLIKEGAMAVETVSDVVDYVGKPRRDKK